MSINMAKARAAFREEGIKALVKSGVSTVEADALPWLLRAEVSVDGETTVIVESGEVSAETHTQTVAPSFPARDALLVAWFRSAALRKATAAVISEGPDAIKDAAKRIRKDHAGLAAEFDAAVGSGTAPTAEERRRVDVRIS